MPQGSSAVRPTNGHYLFFPNVKKPSLNATMILGIRGPGSKVISRWGEQNECNLRCNSNKIRVEQHRLAGLYCVDVGRE